MTIKYIPRDITLIIDHALSEMPVVVITGMRQTGKSTFLQKQPELASRRYVSFDDFAQLEAAKLDPEGFIDTDEPLTIDEAQKCPEIFTAIKRAVDRKRIPGRYLLSGSANFAVLKGTSESLAGRAIYFAMHPMSARELAHNTQEEPFLKTFFKIPETPKAKGFRKIKTDEILNGGMPSVCLGEVKDRALWFKGYEQTYLERDVRELSQIGNIIAFRHMLHLAAMRSGQLLSPSELGRDVKLNAATSSRYLALLETSFVSYRLNPFFGNRASRLIKSPKLYMGDSGLACYLSGITELGPTAEEPLFGAMFETYIAQNLSSIIDARWPEAHLYFWSVQGRHEVDFVIEAGRSCIAIEVKASAKWDDRDLSGLRTFLTATPHCKAGILAYNGTEAVRLGDKLWAIPLGIALA